MKIRNSILKYLFPLLLLSLYSCTVITCPDDIFISGINGIVTDSLGHSLKGVKVFCLYNSSFIPEEPTKDISFLKTLKNNDFNFNLEQNFPNPFSNSTFLRFSLPNRSNVNLEITDSVSNNIVYRFSKELESGYYQLYLKNIVDSLNLKNGPYYYTLNALTDDGTSYSDSKELFIISNKGEPNSRTGHKGYYEFFYANAFVGDSIVVKETENYSDTIILTNKVYLLFEKEGYYSKIIYTTLYPDVELTNDVVLLQKKQ